MSQNNLDFEEQEYDINALFNIQINFDQLKFLISALTKNQKRSNQRIADLEEKINFKDKKIDDIESHIHNHNDFLSTKYKDFYSVQDTSERDIKRDTKSVNNLNLNNLGFPC